MTLALTKTTSRFAAIGLLVGLVAALYGLGVAPLVARHNENRQEITHLRDMLDRYRSVTADIPRIRDTIAVLTERDKTSGLYLHGSTDALTAADLLDRLNQLVEQNGGKVSTVQNLPAEVADGLQKIAVRVHFSGSIKMVQRVLHTIETERPMLFIDAFEIRASTRSQRLNAPADEPDLGVRLDIAGYLRPEA